MRLGECAGGGQNRPVAEDFLPLKFRSEARKKRMQTAQHIAGAVIMLVSALPHLRPGGHHFVLACFEIAMSVVLMAAVVVERKHEQHGQPSRLGWLEMAGGGMLTVEAVEKTQGPHHVSFVIVTFLLPLIMILLGVFGVKLREARTVTDQGDHFGMRLRWRRHRLAWCEMRAYRITPKFLELDGKHGPLRRIRIADIANRAEAEEWIRTRFEARGVPEADQGPAS